MGERLRNKKSDKQRQHFDKNGKYSQKNIRITEARGHGPPTGKDTVPK